MKIKLFALTLFLLTIGTVAWYPKLYASSDPVIPSHVTTQQKPVVDVVFVLDTTGSMSGLIQTAKEKIWSIASTMAAAQPTPEIRIGLVAYRDKGDAYVTKTVDLSSDLDSVYATLMDFQAGGGGDGPESVNKALHDAVYNMSWSRADQAYQVVFLVGDAPPHMDYNEMRYPEIISAALERGIIVNTIQCGQMAATIEPWTQIANLGGGNYFQVEQAGSAVAYTSPFDEEIAALSAKLDDTRLYYGDEEARQEMESKVAATEKLHASASVASRARRAAFNVGEAGRKNMLGEDELVDAVISGDVELEELDADELPAALAPMAPAEQKAYVQKLAKERADLQAQIVGLASKRDEFIETKVEEAGGFDDSLDQRLYETVREQAAEVGLDYNSGPAY